MVSFGILCFFMCEAVYIQKKETVQFLSILRDNYTSANIHAYLHHITQYEMCLLREKSYESLHRRFVGKCNTKKYLRRRMRFMQLVKPLLMHQFDLPYAPPTELPKG